MDMPRILHVTESHAKADGGVTTVVNDLTEHANSLGIYSCVLAATDYDEYTPEGVDFVKLGSSCVSVFSLFSSAIKESIRKLIIDKKINIIHIHGIWQPLQLVAGRLAKEMNIPFLVTSHGMLEPWLWTGKGWKGYIKKKLYFNWAAYPVYKNAHTIHAITPNESENLKKYFPDNCHVVITNAIDLSSNSIKSRVNHDKTIFFIGRIHPKKGVDLLLRSFYESGLSNAWKLVIAGPEEVPEYVADLRAFIKRNNLEPQVSLIGPVFGDEKKYWYRRAWVTVVPSYSEVIGMVNLEASSLECPTITTVNTGLSDWEEGGGLLIRPDVNDLVKSIKYIADWSQDERENRGKASYNLVKNRYSWQVVSREWADLYSELLNERECYAD